MCNDRYIAQASSYTGTEAIPKSGHEIPDLLKYEPEKRSATCATQNSQHMKYWSLLTIFLRWRREDVLNGIRKICLDVHHSLVLHASDFADGGYSGCVLLPNLAKRMYPVPAADDVATHFWRGFDQHPAAYERAAIH